MGGKVRVKTGPIAIGAVLVFAAGLMATPDSAWAQRGGRGFVGGGGRAVMGGRAVVNNGVVANSGARVTVNNSGRAFVGPGFGHRPGFIHHNHRFFRPFFPFVAAAPAVVYAAPYYYPPPAYYSPPYYDPSVYSAPVSYSPPVSYAPPPPAPQAPPAPNVVQFSTGRYELRGDGGSTPYAWVWIPNPPTAPPPPAPTAPPAAEPRSSSTPAPTRAGQLYRWIDAQGVVYWTDRLDAVPEQYRSRTKQTTPS
jgi:hypothetical protein